MCDFSKKLIAQMDGELSEGESVELEQHLRACAECRNRLATYERASGAFEAYCEATFAAERRRRSSRLPAALAVGTAAAVIAALLFFPHQRVAKLPLRMLPASETAHLETQPAEPTVVAPNPTAAAHPIASAINRASLQYPAAAVPVQSSPLRNLNPFPPESHIEIAIPADAMFPPGAVPPGISFTADVTISPDGSPERLGLRPRLAEFERKGNQP